MSNYNYYGMNNEELRKKKEREKREREMNMGQMRGLGFGNTASATTTSSPQSMPSSWAKPPKTPLSSSDNTFYTNVGKDGIMRGTQTKFGEVYDYMGVRDSLDKKIDDSYQQQYESAGKGNGEAEIKALQSIIDQAKTDKADLWAEYNVGMGTKAGGKGYWKSKDRFWGNSGTYDKVPPGMKVSTMLLNGEWIRSLEVDKNYKGGTETKANTAIPGYGAAYADKGTGQEIKAEDSKITNAIDFKSGRWIRDSKTGALKWVQDSANSDVSNPQNIAMAKVSQPMVGLEGEEEEKAEEEAKVKRGYEIIESIRQFYLDKANSDMGIEEFKEKYPYGSQMMQAWKTELTDIIGEEGTNSLIESWSKIEEGRDKKKEKIEEMKEEQKQEDLKVQEMYNSKEFQETLEKYTLTPEDVVSGFTGKIGDYSLTEAALIASKPLAALKVNKNKTLAEEFTQQYFREGWNEDTTEANAFKHAIWQALNSRSLGEELALMFASAHENKTGNSTDNPYKETTYYNATNMDLQNNAIGIAIGSATDNDLPDVEIAKIVYQIVIEQGEGIWDGHGMD